MGKGITDVRGNATVWMMAAIVMISPVFVCPAAAQDKAMAEVIYEADMSAAPVQTAQASERAGMRPPMEMPAGISPEQREMLMSRMRDRITTATAATTRASGGAPPSASPARATKPDDKSTTMMLNLNNMQLDQLMKWLGETTGRPIVKQNNIQGQVTVMSPVPVTKERALQLISRALQMQTPPVFIIDDGESLQIITAEQIKILPRRSIGPEEDIQKLVDSPQLGQKVYKPKLITADNLSKHLDKILPKDSVTVDPQSNTIMLVDQISRLKQYDLLVKALDQPMKEDRVTEVYPLENADVSEIAPLVINVLSQTSSAPPAPRGGGGGDMGGMMAGMNPEMMSMMSGRGRGSSSAAAPRSAAASAGEVTIVSDPRMNWLIIVAPARRVDEVRALIKKFDVAKDQDVQTRMIPVKHIEVSSLRDAAQELIANSTRNKSERDQVSIISSDDGNNLVVKSSLDNFKLVQDLAGKLDTESAGKRDTKTYQIKHLEAAGLAEQLQALFEDQTRRRSWWEDYYGGSSNRDNNKPMFTPMPRNNTLMVRARPRDFEFIDKMVKELDVPADEGQYKPHVFQIRNTDANEVLKVLTQIFEGKQQRRGIMDDYYEQWYGSPRRTPDSIDAQFGKIRFVVDNVTNRIVALSSNPANYRIIEGIVNELDTFDADSAQLMIYELHYADALDVANHLNNLLSDGPVTRGNVTDGNRGGNNGYNGGYNGGYGNGNRNDNGANDSAAQLASYFYDGQREVIYPWQSPGRERQRQNEEERPVSTMIGHVRIVPDLSSNRVIVAAPGIYYNTLKKIISDLDQPQPQVNIQVRIIEISRNGEERIGIRWTPDPSTISKEELDGAMLGLGQLNFVDAFGPHGKPFVGSGSSIMSDGSFLKSNWATETRAGNTLISSGINMNLLVQLLLKNSNGRVVSSPELTVNNNQLGHFKVTSSYPFISESQSTDVGSLNQSYKYNEYGIFLYVRPHINPKGEIVLKAAVENSRVRAGETFNGQLIADLQRLESEMKINSGETMVIGGIKQDDRQKIERGVPILSSIPIIKWLVSKKDDVVHQRELVLFLTPEVLKTDEDKADILERQFRQVDELDPFPKKSWREMEPEKKK